MKNLRSSENKAWIEFLLASDNSIIRDAGETLSVLTGNSLWKETPSECLEQKNPKEWEPALLLAECLQYSEDNNLGEISRIIYEWFHATTQKGL